MPKTLLTSRDKKMASKRRRRGREVHYGDGRRCRHAHCVIRGRFRGQSREPPCALLN